MRPSSRRPRTTPAHAASNRTMAVVKAPTELLFEHEARRDGKVLAVLRGTSNEMGVIVEAEVFPLGQSSVDGIRRPFTFHGRAQADKFVEEALLCLEYLNCEVVG